MVTMPSCRSRKGGISGSTVSLDGPESWEPVVSGGRSSFPLDLRGRKLLFGCSSFNRPMELHLRDLDTGAETELTDLSGPLSGKALPEVRNFTFAASDGASVEGWVMEPTAGTRPFPAVLFVHGGPHLAFGRVFSLDAQMLAGAGFAVVLVNQRGSRGYGDEFANRIIGDWGNRDYRDLMEGVDHVVDRGIVDPDRLGCYGLSYGGYMVCWIVGQTDRFRAMVCENPITDFTSFRGTSDIGLPYARRELGGEPQEIPDVYRSCSPLSFAHRCRTPTLLIQHLEDYRCPAGQSEQFYAALKAGAACGGPVASAHHRRAGRRPDGCPVEMLRLMGSSHNGAIFGPPEVRKAQNRALLDWMTRFLKSDNQ
jgi:dipeptidyl aminopeptidase/acylaminoacyl peptidase